MADTFASHVQPHGPLTALADDLWQVTAEGPPLPRNMAVWRHPSGGLWLHSVVAMDEAQMAALDALGPVRWMVVPNGYHRRDIAVFKARYPEARVICPSAARAKVEEVVRVDATCEDLAGELGVEALVADGVKPGELLYALPLAGGGKALVMADLLFNLADRFTGLRGFVLRHVTASVGPLGTSRVFRLLALQDRGRYAAWLQALAAQGDWRVLCVGHGDAVVEAVGDALRAASGRIR